MPELPEVETIGKQLAKELVGSEIMGEGKVVGVERVGKYLFIKLEGGGGLEIHLKMTGRLIIKPLNHSTIKPLEIDYETAKHTRIVMNLKDGRKIYFWDVRKFGYVKSVNNIQTSIDNLQKRMGPEPWDISDTDFLRKLQKTGRAIKEAILDQSLLSGVGNIYGNDGLWLAGIDPRRIAKSLKLKEVAKLRESLCQVLERGLATGGASDNSYRDFYGGQGSYQKEFLTYGRTGEPCNKCGLALKRIVVGGRGTWMCGRCQK